MNILLFNIQFDWYLYILNVLIIYQYLFKIHAVRPISNGQNVWEGCFPFIHRKFLKPHKYQVIKSIGSVEPNSI